MSKNVIFCYSGTGNCLDMAKNIAKYPVEKCRGSNAKYDQL